MINRWNIEYKKNWLATCQHPRGGHINGTIIKIKFEPCRGKVVTLDCGMSFAADDIQECKKPNQVKNS